MAVAEQFSLRWNDFHSNLSQSLHELLEGEDLVDVTLAAGGQYVHAHKLILSVCSPYFKELFKMNPCEHPIVILKDVAHQELKQLLQFMYRGEVNVRHQELSSFLHTAELLQVKGLTGGRERSESPVAAPEEPRLAQQQVEPVIDQQLDWGSGLEDNTTSSVEIALDVGEAVTVKEEAARSPLKRLLKNTPNKTGHTIKKKPRPIKNSPTHPENSEYMNDSEPLLDFDNDLFHSVLVLPESTKESGVKCPSCHRFFANRYNLKVHIRDKHDTREGTLQCDICQKRMRNPSCLRVHMYHHRKQAAYLAQLSSQGDQMKHVVQNMVGSKWRTDSSMATGDYKDIDNFQLGGTQESNKMLVAHPSGQKDQTRQTVAPRLATGKWRSDSSTGSGDYKDNDVYPVATPEFPGMDDNNSPTPEPSSKYPTSDSAASKYETDTEAA